ncbi:restriction endonuclease [Streptomyces oceani]|uniref:Restriction endonuclease type IV Mrr domain-containing protein n=1 Tax=Streptomyces oceani TaxID=1075402 RepID=A0A1E7JWM6_9ACTN|nr:restriction endonuclease [Streptomyces oceani]OEU96068.1 hypothetical protein AN216_22180 [Streptomyces oceani]
MVHEGVLVESRTMRASVAEHTEALDRAKTLSLLPDGMHVTTRMVADYFEVGIEAIRSLVKDHRAELSENGYRVLTGAEVESFKDLTSLDKYTGRHLALFTRRTVLNVAMLLRDSIVARHVRTNLLDTEQWARTASTTAPVDNSVIHNLVAWLDARIRETVAHQLGQHDARMTRIAEDSVRTVIGQTVVPLLNHAIRADDERRREISDIRREVAAIDRALRARMPVGGMAAMDAMSWREFEEHVAGLCRRDGCVSVANTSRTSDLSADLVGRTADGRTLVVQCKHFAPYRKVESGEMQKFIGMAKVEYTADIALFVTTATFTPAAVDLAVRHGVTAVHRGLLERWSAGRALQVLR